MLTPGPPHPIRLPPPRSLSYSKDRPALPWPCPPEGLSCSQCLSSLVHIHCFCQRLLQSLQGREELKYVSDHSVRQFRVSFIKAAVRPIIYHHVFFLLQCLKQPLQKGTGSFHGLRGRTQMDGGSCKQACSKSLNGSCPAQKWCPRRLGASGHYVTQQQRQPKGPCQGGRLHEDIVESSS